LPTLAKCNVDNTVKTWLQCVSKTWWK